MANSHNTEVFELGGIYFEYDADKQKQNLKKHGISFKIAARVFFDQYCIEAYDETNSFCEDRYNAIGNALVSNNADNMTIIGNTKIIVADKDYILFVVYTVRTVTDFKEKQTEVIRLISARLATTFERGLYYGKIL